MDIAYESIVIYTGHPDRESHRQVGVGMVVRSWNLGGVLVSTLAGNTRDMGSILTILLSHHTHWLP